MRLIARSAPGVPALIAAESEAEQRSARDLPPGTTLQFPGRGTAAELSTYARVLGYFQQAQVVVITLAQAGAYVGLTELLDALACGLPVIHTRSPHLDIDVEAIGCGVRVEPGDAAGLATAIASLMGDPARCHAMGALGRRWLGRHRSSRTFGDGVREILLDAVAAA